jgi:hypothetical protein
MRFLDERLMFSDKMLTDNLFMENAVTFEFDVAKRECFQQNFIFLEN